MNQAANTDQRIDQKTLLEWMGMSRPGPCKKRLEAQGIAVFNGRNGIWTTLTLVNAAGLNKMGIQTKQEDDDYEDLL